MASILYMIAYKGIDVIDDGGNLLNYKYADYYNLTIHIYHKFVTRCFAQLASDPVFLRHMAILIFSISGLLLSVAVYILLKKQGFKIRMLQITSFVLIGSLLTFQDRLFNYNAINLICSTLVVLIAVYLSGCKSKADFVLIFISGLIAGFQIHLKAPSSIVSMIVITVVLLKDFNWIKAIWGASTILTTFFGCCLIFYGSISSWYLNFTNNLLLTRLEGYGSKTHLLSFFGSIVIDALLFLATFIIFRNIYKTIFLRKIPIRNDLLFILLSWAVMVLCSKQLTPVKPEYREGIQFLYKIIGLIPIINIYILTKVENQFSCCNKSSLIFSILFLMMPILLETGGMSSPYESLGTYASYWMASIYITLHYSTLSYKDFKLIYVLIVIVIALNFIHNNLLFPLRQTKSVFYQNELIDPRTGLMTDRDTKIYLDQWKKILDKIEYKTNKPGQILFLYNEAGTVFLLGKQSPLIPLFLSVNNSINNELNAFSKKYNEVICRKIIASDPSRMIVACNKQSLSEEYVKKITKSRLLIDSLYSPYQSHKVNDKSPNVYVFY